MGDEISDAMDWSGIISSSPTEPTTHLYDRSADKRTAYGPSQPNQYTLYNSGYSPALPTVSMLPPDCYDINRDNKCIYVTPVPKPNGLLLDLPEMKSDVIIKLVDTFWASEKDYKLGNEFIIGGASFKSGVMIYGPAGSGKTCTIKLVTKKLIENGGIVLYCQYPPDVLSSFLKDFSKIENDRKCIVVLEDIDSLIEKFGESDYLEMLDSAVTVNNVLFIATTNYPERLDPRIYNRPGRFNHVVKIGLPGDKTREAYLMAILKNHDDVKEIVANTSGFTIDHLTALVNSVYREKRQLSTEIERLASLFKIPKSTGRPIGIESSASHEEQ